MIKQYYVYILANKKDGFMYVGITSDLAQRTWQHKNAIADGHTKKYSIKRLVYFEIFDDPESAITREKQLKKWRRQWKIELIEKNNPQWNELYKEITK